MTKVAAAQKKEKSAAKAQLMREKRELEHMRLRYLAAEEKKVITADRKELDELKNELNQLVLLLPLLLLVILVLFLVLPWRHFE